MNINDGKLEQFQECCGRGGRPASTAAARGNARPPPESGNTISEFDLAACEERLACRKGGLDAAMEPVLRQCEVWTDNAP